jgi:hypothetical protein
LLIFHKFLFSKHSRQVLLLGLLDGARLDFTELDAMMPFQVPTDACSADYRIILAAYTRAVPNPPSSRISRWLDALYGLARVLPKKRVEVPTEFSLA